MLVPLAVHGVAALLTWSWLPRLPEEVALHWGAGGVDRVGPVGELMTISAVLAGTTFALMAVAALTVGRSSLTRRMVLALATGGAVFFAGVHLTQAWTQLDLTDPWQAPSVDLWFAAVIMLALVPLMLTMFVWDVRVDAAGLTVRGAMG